MDSVVVKNSIIRTGAMAKWLRIFAVLPEGKSLVPSTHVTPALTPSFGLYGHCIHMCVHIHMSIIYIYIIYTDTFKKKKRNQSSHFF